MRLISRLAGSLLTVTCLLIGAPSHAAGSADIKAVRYPAWVENGERKTPLVPGMQIKPSDIVVSGEDARILFSLPDGSEMRLGQKARLSIGRIEASKTPSGTDLDMGLSLLAGHFRYASNALGKLTGKRKLELRLTTATIGIRGTDYWAMTDQEHDAVCLFEGAVDVQTQEKEAIALDKPTAFWVRYFDKPTQPPGNASAAQLAEFLGWVELAPGSGVAIGNGRWRLIAGAEKTADTAQALGKSLREQGFPARVSKSSGLHEVRIDRFATRADAEAQLKKLEAHGGLLGSEPKVVLTR